MEEKVEKKTDERENQEKKPLDPKKKLSQLDEFWNNAIITITARYTRQRNIAELICRKYPKTIVDKKDSENDILRSEFIYNIMKFPLKPKL